MRRRHSAATANGNNNALLKRAQSSSAPASAPAMATILPGRNFSGSLTANTYASGGSLPTSGNYSPASSPRTWLTPCAIETDGWVRPPLRWLFFNQTSTAHPHLAVEHSREERHGASEELRSGVFLLRHRSAYSRVLARFSVRVESWADRCSTSRRMRHVFDSCGP